MWVGGLVDSHAGRYAVDDRCCSYLVYMKVSSYDNVKPLKTGATASTEINQQAIDIND